MIYDKLKTMIMRKLLVRVTPRIALTLLVMMFAAQLYSNDYESEPAIKTFTNTGSGTTIGPAIDYSGESLDGGTDTYTNGQLCFTLYNYSTLGKLTLAFQAKKSSGYFVNGNSGKLFAIDESEGAVYAQSFSISNSTTDKINFRLYYSEFVGSRTFSFYLITSDKKYKQYGGSITVTCTSQYLPPTITTLAAKAIDKTSATLNGMVRPNGKTTSYEFLYGTSRSNLNTVYSGTVSYNKAYQSVDYTLTGLTPGKTYYFQLTGSNSVGSSEGDILSFQTESYPAPEITTLDANNINQNSATLHGMVRPNGSSTDYTFLFGTNRSNMKTVSSGTVSGSKSYQSVNYTLTGLAAGTTYVFQLTGSNSGGSDEGDILSFQTETAPNNPPTIPTNPSPSNGATDIATSGTFSWNCSDADGDVIKYNIYLGTSYSNLSFYKSSANTLCGFENLSSGTTYYWRVDPYDNEDTTTGTIWHFKTASSSPSDLTEESAVSYLQGKGIVDGSTFSDANTGGDLLRQHLAKIAFLGVYKTGSRTVPSSIVSDNLPTVYEDLSKETTNNSYYFRAARALLYLEYGDGVTPFDRDHLSFGPTETICRIDVLKVLMETFNIQPNVTGTNNPYPQDGDVVSLMNNNPYKMGYIREAADEGIIDKKISTWRPFDSCKRGEAMLMLARIMQKVEAGSITDPAPSDADYFVPLNTTLATISLGLSLPLGNFQHYTKTSFALSGTVPLVFAHAYNSYNTTLPEVFYGLKNVNGSGETYQPLGDGWSHNYHSFLTVVGSIAEGNLRAVVHWGGGSFDVYKSNGSEIVPESYGVYDKFSISNGTVTIKTKEQVEYYFTKQGGSGAVLYLTSIKDRNGNTLTLNYEAGENSLKRITSVSDGNRSLTFSYKSGTNLLSKVSDPLGRSIKFDYSFNDKTKRYQLSSFTDAEGQVTHYGYGNDSKVSTSKLLTEVQLPKGNYVRNEYDANRRLTKTENGTTKTTIGVTPTYGSSGSSASTSSQVEVTRNGSTTSTYNYQFNGNNVVTSMSGPKQLSVTSTYYTDANKCHLPKTITTNNANISNVTYDDNGNVTSVSVTGDGTTLTTTMTYDTMNNLTSVTDPKGYKTTYSYDSKGNLTEVSAPEGVSTSIEVNSKGLPTKVTNAVGVVTQFTYNTYGNLTKTTLPALSLSSSATYDKASRVTSSTDALGRTTSFDYDDNDNLRSETDSQDHTTSYDYDANDNLISITNAKGGVTSLSYDNTTDWLTSVSFAGSTKRYAYNDDGTLNRFTKPDGTTLDCTYDELGRITNDGVNDYTYDDKLRLQSVTGSDKTLTLSYDGFNRITGTNCGGHSNSYTYDKNGNCTSVNGTTYGYDKLNRLISVTFSGKTISYTYRKDSKLSTAEYPNGMTTTYGYDAVGRLASKQTKLSNGTVIAGYSYTLDKVGNIVEQTTIEPCGEIAMGNEDVSYSYNSGNRITKAGDISFEFDANGNTTKRGSEQYQWDKSDRLTKAGSTSLTYDPLGLIASYGDITFTTDPLGIGNVLSDSRSGAEYIYGNGLEARVKSGKVSYYVTDVRGSVVAIVDESGKVTHKYQYDDFGKVVQKQEADYNPFQYVGKYGVMYLNDHQYYMRARHYDPTIGRFISEDPIWSTNLYPYAENNPIMGIDPEGKIETLSTGYEIYQGIKTVTSVGTQYGLSTSTKAYIASEVAKDKLAADAIISSLGSSSSTVAASSTTAASTTAASTTAVGTAGMSVGATIGAVGCVAGITAGVVVLTQDTYKAVQNAVKADGFVDFIDKQNENGGWIYKGTQWLGNKTDQFLDNTLGKVIN